MYLLSELKQPYYATYNLNVKIGNICNEFDNGASCDNSNICAKNYNNTAVTVWLLWYFWTIKSRLIATAIQHMLWLIC